MRLAAWIVLAFATGVSAPHAGAAEPLAKSTVGVAARITDLVLPAPRLVAAEAEADDPEILVRVDEAAPHGTAFRYTLEVTAFVPGVFDLANQLVTESGAPATGLPPLPFEAASLLPPERITPNDPAVVGPGWFGGYRLAAIAATAAWLFGLAAILLVGRGKRRVAVEAGPTETDAQRFDRLLAEASADGAVLAEDYPAVERLVLSCLQHACGVSGAAPRDVGDRLRSHPEAGPLLGRLEALLHRPGGDAAADLKAILADVREILRRSNEANGSAASSNNTPVEAAS